MQHLTPESLARLVDEPADPAEALHLGSCLVCRRELDGMREQTRALGELSDPEIPAGAWAALETRLVAEGLIRGAAAPRRFRMTPTLRIAASVALFLLGGASGAALWERVSRPASPTQPLASVDPVGSPVPVAGVDPVVSTPEPAIVIEEMEVPASAETAPGIAFASTGTGPEPRAAAPRPARRSPAAAAAAELARTQREYLAALQRYAELAAPASGADDATRLRALNGLVATTQAALDLAPADPVINEYHLGAVEMRDALLRQLARQSESTWF